MERGLKKAAEEAEDEARDIGRDLGDIVSEGIEKSLGEHGRDFADGIEDGLDGERVKVRVRYVYERDRRSGEVFRRRVFEDIQEVVEDALDTVTRGGGGGKGGGFNRIGAAFSDALGAGFNVSGRSPLIALLLPIFLAIGNLITAIIVALQPLGAFLLSLPTLLASIGIQAAIVGIAFNGIGEAVGKAFAAKNAKEMAEALRGLQPPARDFVKALLPLKDLWRDLKSIIQFRFFSGMTDNIKGLIKALDPILRRGLWDAAYAVGQVFQQLTAFFQSKTFTTFLEKVFPLTVEWLNRFGPAFIMFLDGLISAATTLMPFLKDFGSLLAGELEIFGTFLKDFAEDPKTAQYLDTAYLLLKSIFELVNGAAFFVSSLVTALADAGGQRAIDAITEGLLILGGLLQTDFGKHALEGLIDIFVLGTQAVVGMIVVLLAIGYAIRAVGEFFYWLWNDVLMPFFRWAGDRLAEFWRWWSEPWKKVYGTFKEIPTKIQEVFKNAGSWLVQAGKNLIQGLINGVKSMFGSLGDAAAGAMNIIGRFLPGSPAEEGPLSGSGYSYLRGQRMVSDFAAGIKSETKTLSSVSNMTMGAINFGPGAVRVSYNGVTPTPEQARMTGSAIGSGISGQLAVRNTRLAVRTL